ncbi:hypothetical protein SmJEL517_g00224 [Synchytrium microbalum]|uniref:AAA+ ATPase domain-containing protein n=1 Tax=Synchytrium microbalum TaxID=1806994 RepID=A0A507C9E3_9FUNG|nr:uncharacterized protein SmJEL517_g00224 [Synchytrium microbalum]TPX38200.1 hypothetical protein SmJEL517_g00224 [Synchytrium microbalum]
MGYGQKARRAIPRLVASERISTLFNALISGDRAALARSITLVESTRADHRKEAQELLSLVLDHAKKRTSTVANWPTTFRVGLSGSPGVGKSSFIETFGMFLIAKGHKVAVLAVDPSSTRTGGSILGDKTRMTLLSRADEAYVRPSPTSGNLGGVARNTNEAILLCEASGYDIILVETVGVGQSETMVSDMTDMFTLLVAPGAGDELQGMKKGIVEMSDLILVNKADGVLAIPARAAQMEYTSALKFSQPAHPDWRPKVLAMSSAENIGIDKVWEAMQEYYKIMQESGSLHTKRGLQRKKWMWQQITDELLWRLKTDSNVKDMVLSLEAGVFRGDITSGQAAEDCVRAFIHDQALTQ